jgi:hypothetical protein
MKQARVNIVEEKAPIGSPDDQCIICFDQFAAYATIHACSDKAKPKILCDDCAMHTILMTGSCPVCSARVNGYTDSSGVFVEVEHIHEAQGAVMDDITRDAIQAALDENMREQANFVRIHVPVVPPVALVNVVPPVPAAPAAPAAPVAPRANVPVAEQKIIDNDDDGKWEHYDPLQYGQDVVLWQEYDPQQFEAGDNRRNQEDPQINMLAERFGAFDASFNAFVDDDEALRIALEESAYNGF